MQIGTKELGDEVTIAVLEFSSRTSIMMLMMMTVIKTYISSRGEMKISLREMTCARLISATLNRTMVNNTRSHALNA